MNNMDEPAWNEALIPSLEPRPLREEEKEICQKEEDNEPLTRTSMMWGSYPSPEDGRSSFTSRAAVAGRSILAQQGGGRRHEEVVSHEDDHDMIRTFLTNTNDHISIMMGNRVSTNTITSTARSAHAAIVLPDEEARQGYCFNDHIGSSISPPIQQESQELSPHDVHQWYYELQQLQGLVVEEDCHDEAATTVTVSGTSSITSPRGNRTDFPSSSSLSESSSRVQPHSSTSPTRAGGGSSSSGVWMLRFKELQDFRKEFGHVMVPTRWPQNPALSQWVKRQRYQYKLLKGERGVSSNLTPDRLEKLNEVGFVWESHSAFWEERLNELNEFRHQKGHANVPTKYPKNPPLATWVKCQRRQFKLFCADGPNQQLSSMTWDRVAKLAKLNFCFDPSGWKKNSRSSNPLSYKDLLGKFLSGRFQRQEQAQTTGISAN